MYRVPIYLYSLSLFKSSARLFFFFFFQAEDGIRDHCVTGVQTCALPIYQIHSIFYRLPPLTNLFAAITRLLWLGFALYTAGLISGFFTGGPLPRLKMVRSEERRVGKECRARWWRYH